VKFKVVPVAGASPAPREGGASPTGVDFDFYDLRIQSAKLPGPALSRVNSGERYHGMLYVRMKKVPSGARVAWSYVTGTPGGTQVNPVSGTDVWEALPNFSDDIQYTSSQRSNLSGRNPVEQEVTATVTINGVTKTRKTRFTVVPRSD
jgi:hypothetical protein